MHVTTAYDAMYDDGSCRKSLTIVAYVAFTISPGLNCETNVEDAIGVCGGDCEADADADGICDDVDSCVGEIRRKLDYYGAAHLPFLEGSNIPEGD